MRIVLLILPVFLIGCSYTVEIENTSDTLFDLCHQVHTTVLYAHEDTNLDYFQSPIETTSLLTGDCEDFTILFMYLAKTDLGIKPDMQVVSINNTTYHALAYYDGIYYDPTNNYIFEELPDSWHPVIRWDYDVIMLYATGFYTKGELNVNSKRI